MRSIRRLARIPGALAPAVLLAVPCHAIAAESDQGSAAGVMMEEILVTAQRKGQEEAIHDVPLAISAFSGEQVEAMFGHLQSGLEAIGFLDPANPRKLMSRLRRLLARSGLEREEVNILRGIAKHMLVARGQPDRKA